jgi:hypothetical protein
MLRLVRARFDAGVALDVVRVGARPRAPPRRWTHTVVFPNGDELRRMQVSKSALVVVAALARGETLGEAAACVPANSVPALGGWFEGCVAAGPFSG